VSAQAGQSAAVNETSLESTAQDDDFREVKRRKRNVSNHTSQTAKKSNKPVPTCTAVKLSPKAVFTRNFLAPLRPMTMKETTETEDALPDQEALRVLGRLPSTEMTSTTNLIPVESNLK
jgi:hypothetical protein